MSGPAIFVVQVPATMRTSAWRGLARNGNKPEAVHVVLAGRGRDHLDGTAGESREQRPQAVHPDEVEHDVGLGRDDLEGARPAGVVASTEAARLELGQVGDVALLAAAVCLRVGRLPERVGDDERNGGRVAAPPGRSISRRPQPKVKQYASTPASRNSISNRRSSI